MFARTHKIDPKELEQITCVQHDFVDETLRLYTAEGPIVFEGNDEKIVCRQPYPSGMMMLLLDLVQAVTGKRFVKDSGPSAHYNMWYSEDALPEGIAAA